MKKTLNLGVVLLLGFLGGGGGVLKYENLLFLRYSRKR